MDRLVLFDIDGTILNSDGAGSRSVLHALESIFGRPVRADGYSMGGKTDTQIVLELTAAAGVAREETMARLDRIWEVYLAGLEAELQTTEPRVCPGIPELLHRLSESPGVLLGLLTGNVERGAWLKVGRVGLAEFFRMGAFGDRAPERRILPEVAQQKAEALVGRRFVGKEIVIVGDTPNDILCGRHLGVKSVAVATGSYPSEALAEHAPDHCFEDLSDTEGAMSAILA